jgi:hypothetical protein
LLLNHQQSTFNQANQNLDGRPGDASSSENFNGASKEKLKSTSNNKLLDVDEIDAELACSANLNAMMNTNGNLAKLNRFKMLNSLNNETHVSPKHQNSPSTTKYQQTSQQQQQQNKNNMIDANLLSNLRRHIKPSGENMSRSFSLNDLISAANELLVFNTDDIFKVKSNLRDKPTKNEKIHSKHSISSYNLTEANGNYKNLKLEESPRLSGQYLYPDNSMIVTAQTIPSLSQPPPPITSHFTLGVTQPSIHFQQATSAHIQIVGSQINSASPILMPNKHSIQQQQHSTYNVSINGQMQRLHPILKNNTSNQPILNLSSQMKSVFNSESNEIIQRLDQYKLKQTPKQRLEIDILPSYLHFSRDILLIASCYGKIRLVDLFSYKIHKDELKNLLLNGICIPKNPEFNPDILYAVTNGQMSNDEDELNVSNSTIIVTKRELKVLKKADDDPSDNYVFSNPSGICYDDYDNLYVCDTGNNRVKVLNYELMHTFTIETASGNQDRLLEPRFVCSYQNMLFVSDSSNRRVVSYNIINKGKEFSFRHSFGIGDEGSSIAGGELSGSALRYPLECCVDQYGILHVRDQASNTLQLYANNQMPFHTVDIGADGETIHSISVSDNGDIYVGKHLSTGYNEADSSGLMISKYFIDIY